MTDIKENDKLPKIVAALLDGLKEKGYLAPADIETILAAGKAA
jgi:hypothetical protein